LESCQRKLSIIFKGTILRLINRSFLKKKKKKKLVNSRGPWDGVIKVIEEILLDRSESYLLTFRSESEMKIVIAS
jgi:hypothetical protein